MFVQNLKCEVCEEGFLGYDPQLTFKARYSEIQYFKAENIIELIDNAFNQYSIFSCSNCGAEVRYTFKELEKLTRQDIKRRFMDIIARNDLINSGGINISNKVFVFCNGCNGFDGKGSCPIEIYRNCKLKKIPSVI